jgi:hypothetical protein
MHHLRCHAGDGITHEVGACGFATCACLARRRSRDDLRALALHEHPAELVSTHLTRAEVLTHRLVLREARCELLRHLLDELLAAIVPDVRVVRAYVEHET